MTPLGDALRGIQWRGNKQIERMYLDAGRKIASSIIAHGELRNGKYILTHAGAARVRQHMRVVLIGLRPGLAGVLEGALQQTASLAARTEGEP